VTFTANDVLQSGGSAERHQSTVFLPDTSRRRQLLSGINFEARTPHLCWRQPGLPRRDDGWRC